MSHDFETSFTNTYGEWDVDLKKIDLQLSPKCYLRHGQKLPSGIHNLFSDVCLFFFAAMLMYRTCRCCRRIWSKLLHTTFHLLAAPCIAIAFVAVYVRVHHMFSRILNFLFVIGFLGKRFVFSIILAFYNLFWLFHDHPFKTDQNKWQISWKIFKFCRFRIRENMWWTRYRISKTIGWTTRIFLIPCPTSTVSIRGWVWQPWVFLLFR